MIEEISALATFLYIVKTNRWFNPDPWLAEDETLEYSDYKEAFDRLKLSKGHQAPLGSFKGTDDWQETNYLSNITPQKADLNQGPWKELEEKVRNFVTKDNTVYVMTGPLFEKRMPLLPKADEPHKVPSGYWKIIFFQQGKTSQTIRVASFIFDQETPRRSKLLDHLSTINDIEQRSGLDFLWEIPDEEEERIESNKYLDWVLTLLD